MRRKLPSTTALTCFEAAAHTQNFALAAQAVSLSPSAFSRQIKELEKHVGQPLFIRQRQRVKLTSTGSMLLAELTPILESLEVTLLGASNRNNPYGAINIGTYPTLGSRWLMPKLSQLSRQQAQLSFNTITYLANDQIDANLIDIALVQGDPPWSGFRADALMPESLVVITSPELLSHPLGHAQDLLKQRILQHITRPASWQIWFDSLAEELTVAPLGPMFSQFEMLINAVIEGLGIAIVPKVLVTNELADGRLILAHEHEALTKSGYYLLTPKVKVGTARIEMLRDWLLGPL